jgi:hypothetical protein
MKPSFFNLIVQNYNCATSKKLISSFVDSTIYDSFAYKDILKINKKPKSILHKRVKIRPTKILFPKYYYSVSSATKHQNGAANNSL